MVAKAKHCCPAASPLPGRPVQKGEAAEGIRHADQGESPSIEIDDRLYIQRLATEIDLDGDPDSALGSDEVTAVQARVSEQAPDIEFTANRQQISAFWRAGGPAATRCQMSLRFVNHCEDYQDMVVPRSLGTIDSVRSLLSPCQLAPSPNQATGLFFSLPPNRTGTGVIPSQAASAPDGRVGKRAKRALWKKSC